MSPQDRLERVWTLLCMPDAQRLDMAIKYSAEPYSNNLLEVSEMALCVAYLVWLSFVRNLQNCSLFYLV